MSEKENRVESVERALSILEAFSEEKSALTLKHLADETGLYKSTILRLAASLERYGYLSKMNDGKYRIGPSVWRLGSLYRRPYSLGEYIRPELRKLVSSTGETASFYIGEKNERVCLYRENSEHAVRFHLDEGSRLQLGKGAAAHVICAYTNFDPSNETFCAVRRQRYSISTGERNPEVAAVAVPVFDIHNVFRGALAISGPISRFDENARAAALKALKSSANDLNCALD